MSAAGPRAKSKTHGTAPAYERGRRNRASIIARSEKRTGRQARRLEGVGEQATVLDIWACARKAMGSRYLPTIFLKREDHR